MAHIIGVDAGNRATKTALGRSFNTTYNGFEPYTEALGTGDLDTGASSADIFEYQGKRWRANPDAITPVDLDRFFEWPDNAVLSALYAASKLDMPYKKRTASLMIGAPMDVLNNAEEARDAARDALVGVHDVVLNGNELQIVIEKTGVASQPKAAVVTIPNWREPNIKTLVVDCGFETCHVALHEYKAILKRSHFYAEATGWAPIGASVAASEYAEYLNDAYLNSRLNKRVGLHEADNLLNTTNEPTTRFLLDREFARIVQFIEAKTRVVAPDRLYFVGGCAARHRARILTKWGKLAHVPAHPVYSVAEGLLAMGKGLLK